MDGAYGHMGFEKVGCWGVRVLGGKQNSVCDTHCVRGRRLREWRILIFLRNSNNHKEVSDMSKRRKN